MHVFQSNKIKRIIDRARIRSRNAINVLKALFSSEKYNGYCTICGDNTVFTKKGKNLRETFSCSICHSCSRNRFLAKVLLDHFNIKPPYALGKLIEQKPDLKVYETASYGPIHNILKQLESYFCSEYFYDVPSGEYNKKGIRCENIEHLTFPDNSFDVVITQDIFEHVRIYRKGFKEIHRVLKKGGIHIFSVPINPWKQTFQRIEVKEGKEIDLAPRAYHGDPTRGGLVYTDFGYDLPSILEEYQFSTTQYTCTGFDGKYYGIYWICAFVSMKI